MSDDLNLDIPISIHAPRTGSDQSLALWQARLHNFNPRSPHGERLVDFIHLHAASGDFNPRSPHGERHTRRPQIINNGKFQSTLPARGATRQRVTPPNAKGNFNPRSPHGERLKTIYCSTLSLSISIHAPRTGSDCRRIPAPTRRRYFNPRSPHGERLFIVSFLRLLIYFNPRSPHGERLRKVTILSIRIIGFAQKVYHKTVLLRISLAENAVILPEKPRNPVRTSLQKAGGLRFARAIRAARPYSISSPSGA